MKRHQLLVAFFGIFYLPSLAMAGAVINYHGRIVDRNGHPVEKQNVVFQISVFSASSKKCLLYEETRNVSMLNSNGVFVIPIGDLQGHRTQNDPGVQMEKVFLNSEDNVFNTAKYPKLKCHSGSSYTPSALDQRYLAVAFDEGSGYGFQELPLMEINFVPMAINSLETQNVGGVAANSVLRVQGQDVAPLTPQIFNELMNITSGSSSTYEKSGHLKGHAVPTLQEGDFLGWTGGTWGALSPVLLESDPLVKDFAKTDLPLCTAEQFLMTNGSGGLSCGAPTFPTQSPSGVTSVGIGVGLKNTSDPGQAITGTGVIAIDVGTGPSQIVQISADGKLPILDGSRLTNVQASNVSTASIEQTHIQDGAIGSAQIQTGAVSQLNKIVNNPLSPGVNRLLATDTVTGTTVRDFFCTVVGQTLRWTGAGGFACESLNSSSISDFSTQVESVLNSKKGISGGIASLNAQGRVPASELGSGVANASSVLSGDGTWKLLREPKPWVTLNADTELTSSSQVFADTSAGSFTLHLPADPTVGDVITILDVAGKFDSFALNVGANGNRIMGLNEDMTIGERNISVDLVWSGAVYGWRVK